MNIFRKPQNNPVASIIEEMRACTPPIATDVVERPAGPKRVDERVAERAAEQERRRREAVSYDRFQIGQF